MEDGEAQGSTEQTERNDKFTTHPCGGEAIRKLRGGIWVLEGDKMISEQVATTGRLDFDTLVPYVLAHINPGDTVVDVGAFIGDHTVAYAKAVGEGGKVVAYEPNPEAFHCLIHNVEHCGNVVTFNHALGSGSNGSDLTGEFASAYLQEGAHGTRVSVRPLDNFASVFSRIDLIKIDVEGYELNVLEGAENMITTFRPKLVIEINEIALKRQNTAKEDVFLWLNEHGYKWKVLHYHQDNAPFYDILCLPEALTHSVVQDTEGEEGFPVVSSQPPATSPLTPKGEMIKAIEFCKAFAAESPHNRMLVMQRLTYAGLKTPTYKKKKP